MGKISGYALSATMASDDLFVSVISGATKSIQKNTIMGTPGAIGDVVPSPGRFGGAADYFDIDTSGVVSLVGGAKGKLRLRPSLDLAVVGKNEKPTMISIGVFRTFSMPIWSTPANSDEELYYEVKIAARWDGASDLVVPFHVALGGAEDVGKKFKFQLSWEHDTCGGVIPSTSNDVEVEATVLTGRNAQYDSYCVEFTVDHDIDGVGNEIQAGSLLAGRLRRVAASSDEVANEVLVRHAVEIDHRVDKIFGTW